MRCGASGAFAWPTTRSWTTLRAEYEALREDGIAAEWVDGLPAPLEATFRGAILHPGDGSLPACPLGATARRSTCGRGRSRDRRGDAGRVARRRRRRASSSSRPDGCTNGLPAGARPGRSSPVRGQVIVTEPLGGDARIRGRTTRATGSITGSRPRTARLVLGGRRDRASTRSSRTGTITEPIQAELEAFARRADRRAEPRIEHRRPGVSSARPRISPARRAGSGQVGLWVSAGYSGHAATSWAWLVVSSWRRRSGRLLDSVFDPARLL